MCPHPGNLAASWSASGRVSIWDLTPAIEAVDGGHRARHAVHRPEFTFKGHSDEGYALDWSPLVPYRMASGDNASFTHVWNRKEDGGWVVDPKASEPAVIAASHLSLMSSDVNPHSHVQGTRHRWRILRGVRPRRQCSPRRLQMKLFASGIFVLGIGVRSLFTPTTQTSTQSLGTVVSRCGYMTLHIASMIGDIHDWWLIRAPSGVSIVCSI